MTKEYITGLSKSRLIELILELQEKHNRLAIQLEDDTSTEEEKKPRKNSENSSLPSSKDIAKGKVQTKTPQKKGPKFGHTGISRKRVAEPDIIIFNKIKKCPRTHQPIDSTSSSYQAHQVIELIPGAMQVIEIRRQTTTGPDGKTVTAPNIDGIDDYQHYGPYLKSVVGSMRYEYHMEWDNIKKMLMAMYGFKKIAQGALNNIFAELKEELENDYAGIGKSVKEAKIKGADETGARINGEPG
ncbi:MAG TPA: hypothetical protein DC049_02510, partial [Spirochaetia bacterium]|nr:hypothetical protein [Spirochaetia bacterium]